MKAKIILTALVAIILAACNSKQDSVLSFIPGTYVNSAKGEYAQAEDTLTITVVSDNNYQIIRKTTYQAIRDGKLLPKRHQVQKLNAVWDSGKQELDETVTGKIFLFDRNKRLLLINQATYNKIN